MNEVATCLIGAKVIVTPDAEVTEKGVDQKTMEGVVVAAFLACPMPNVPHFRVPHFSVLVDGSIWPCVPTCRMEVVEIPALAGHLALDV